MSRSAKFRKPKRKGPRMRPSTWPITRRHSKCHCVACAGSWERYRRLRAAADPTPTPDEQER